MTRPNYALRIRNLRRLMRQRKWSCFLATYLPNVRYLCGFTGSNATLLLGRVSATLFTDGRYTVQARQEGVGVRVEIPKEPLLRAAGLSCKDMGRVTVGIEADSLTLAQGQALRGAAGTKVTLAHSVEVVGGLRGVKEAFEVDAIGRAAHLICKVFEVILNHVRPGIREFELAAEIEYQMRGFGAEGPSFDTIVAAGPRSALPHARPTSRKLRKNELVVLDMGAILGGYCSDLTRTVFIGRAPERVRGWYRAVWEAHQAARDAVRPGAECGHVDAAARAALRRHGLDKYFTHSTGHGIGLEIHEGPRLARGQKTPLVAGNVVTIEPGIYVEGVGGVRIEDDVLVTAQGHRVLTKMCGELLQL